MSQNGGVHTTVKTLALFATVVAGALTLAACGTSGKQFLSTKMTLRALRAAGFANLRVISNKRSYSELIRTLGQSLSTKGAAQALDEDLIFASGAASPRSRFGLIGPLAVIRLPSTAFAKKTYEGGYSPAALKKQVADIRRKYPGTLPRGFDFAALRTARVCNVIVASYNPNRDVSLNERLTRAISLLRRLC